MKFEEIAQYIQQVPEHINFVNKVGMKYGKLNILFYAGESEKGKKQFATQCDCGKYLIVQTSNLAPTNMRLHCGCSISRPVKSSLLESRINRVHTETQYEVVDSCDGKYDSNWTFNCKTHGHFLARWGKVVNEKTDCPACMYSNGGFDQTSSGYFYLNKVTDQDGNMVALKYGSTNNPVNVRLKQIETKSVYLLENLASLYFTNGTEALETERKFSKEFGKKFLTRKEMRAGFTETVSPNQTKNCLKWLTKLTFTNI